MEVDVVAISCSLPSLPPAFRFSFSRGRRLRADKLNRLKNGCVRTFTTNTLSIDSVRMERRWEINTIVVRMIPFSFFFSFLGWLLLLLLLLWTRGSRMIRWWMLRRR